MVRIDADSKSRQAVLTVVSTDERVTEHGPFDLVIYASIAAEPYMPSLPGSAEFGKAGGEQLHSCECTDEVLQRLISRKKRVAVVGASKSGVDMILALLAAGLDIDTCTVG